MRRYLNLIVLLLFLSVAVFSEMPAEANGSLQDKINETPSGGTLSIDHGIYSGNFVISKDITLKAEGEVVLTRPWTEYDTLSSQVEELPIYPEDMPIITVHTEGGGEIEVNLEGLTFAQPTSGDVEADYTTIAVLAGSGVNLSMTDCVTSGDMGDFYAPVVVTTWDDVFESALGNVIFSDFGIEEDSSAMPSSLTMTGCDFSDYFLAGAVLLGDGITGTFEDNIFRGYEEVPPDANMAMSSLTEVGLSALSGTLFNQDLTISGNYEPGLAGILIANSRDDLVTLKANTFLSNYAGVAAIKGGLEQPDKPIMFDAAVEAGQGLSIEGETNEFKGNLIGVAALGGLDVALTLEQYTVDSDDYLSVHSADITLGEPMPLFIQEATFTNNVIGTLMAGKVKATVDSNNYIGDPGLGIGGAPLAGLVGLGDLSDSYITNNEFKGITGASMLFGMQKVNIDEAIDEFSYVSEPAAEYMIDQKGMLTVSGNTVTGNGPIENAHELLFGPEAVVTEAIALGQSALSGGPLSILDPGLLTSQVTDDDDDTVGPEDVSLAGIVFLDGAQNIVIDDNEITGNFLGIAGIDTGIIEGIQSVDITGNNVSGNIAGLTLAGAAGLIVPPMLQTRAFMSPENLLALGDASGNTFNNNHIGLLSALSVEGEIHDNFFNENKVLGMAHVGIGDWLFSAGLAEAISGDVGNILNDLSYTVSGDILPELYIHNNDIRNNGTDTETVPPFMNEPLGEVTPDMMLRGGVLVIDAANENFKLNNNNIVDNFNYGVLATGRATDQPEVLTVDAQQTEVISSDEAYWLDAVDNFWGSEEKPGSYTGSGDVSFGEGFLFEDPASGVLADGSGDGICGIVLEIDGIYYPYSMTPATTYVRPTNTIKFSPASPTPFEVNPAPVPSASSSDGNCSVGVFPISFVMLMIPLALMVLKK